MRFLVFELWSLNHVDTPWKTIFVPRDVLVQCFETDFWVHEFFLASFSFWDMVYFAFNIRSDWGLEIFLQAEKSTISQKLKSQKKLMNSKIRFRTLCISWDDFLYRHEWATISQKLKIVWIEKLFFHSFQNITQVFGPTNENGSLWGRGREGGRRSACRQLRKKSVFWDSTVSWV